MDPLLLSVIVIAAADATNPWAVLGAVATILATLLSAFVGVGAYKAKRAADHGQHELDAVKVSIDSMKEALIAANDRADRAESDFDRLATQIISTRAEVDQLRAELANERRECAQDRRLHADRIKVLIRRIHELGGTPDDQETP